MGDELLTTPTRQELATIPRRARAAFAFRCAERVFTLYEFYLVKPSSSKMIISELMGTRKLIVEYVGCDPETLSNVIKHANELARLSRSIAMIPEPRRDEGQRASFVVNAVEYAAGAAVEVVQRREDSDSAAVDASAEAASVSIAAAAGIGSDARRRAIHAVRRDFELIRRLAVSESWGHDTGVDLARLGPLWPEGEPEGWPEMANEPRASDDQRYVLELEFDEDATDEQIAEAVAERVAAIDRLHRAEGGRGIKVDAVYADCPVRDRVTT